MNNHPAPLKLRVDVEKWPLKAPFRITDYTMVELNVVVVTLQQDDHSGRGEAAGVSYLGDDVPSMLSRIEAVRGFIEAGIDHKSLQRLLPAGGARNALDCAWWDLEAKLKDRPVWDLAGLDEPKPLLTAYTIDANAPAKMAGSARAFADAKVLKLKLTGEAVDAERVRAVRAARSDVELVVDANQGLTLPLLEALLPVLVQAQVTLIEQPFKIGAEAQLDGLKCPIAIAADESAQRLSDLPGLVGRFDFVNIKLDKCGGLTEALAIAREARRLGLDVMVGNMHGTSLAMAPAFLVGQLCTFADLDGPMHLQNDRSPKVIYENGKVWCPQAVWGLAG